MGYKKVAAGDRTRKSAAEYNAFLDAAQWVQAHVWDQPGGPDKSPRASFDRVRVENFTQENREQFDCVELGALLILGSGGAVDGKLQIVFEGLKPGCDSSGSLRTWPDIRTPRHTAVLLQPLYWDSSGSSGQVGWAAVAGIHPATVDVGNTLHRRASAVANSCELASNMIGPYEILNAVDASGSQTCIVKKSNRASIKLVGVTSSGGIDAGVWSGSALTPGSGSVELVLWDETVGKYKLSGIDVTIHNIADEISANKGVSFSTDDDGVPTVDVEPCQLTYSSGG